MIAGAVWQSGQAGAAQRWAEMTLWLLGAGAVYLALSMLLLRTKAGQSARLAMTLMGVGLLARLLLLPLPVFPTRDTVRYLWDGKLRSEGKNPYASVPNASEHVAARALPVFARLEHRNLPTLYPPTSQWIFGWLWRMRPGSLFVFKVGFALADGAAMALLFRLLLLLKRPPGWIGFYALSPLVLFEIAGAGHQDSLAACFLAVVLLALHSAGKGARVLAGGAWAAGVLAKGYMLALAIPVLRKSGRWGAGTALLAAFALSLPFLTGGEIRLEGLSAYVQNWVGYGSLYRLGQWASGTTDFTQPSRFADALCLLTLLGGVLWLSRRAAPKAADAELRTLRSLSGLTVLCAKIYFPWYFVGVLPVLTLAPSFAWLVFSALLPLLYLPHLRLTDPSFTPWLLLALYLPLYAGLLREALNVGPPASPEGRKH